MKQRVGKLSVLVQGLILNSSPIWLFRSLCSSSGDGVVSKWCGVSWVKLSYVSQLKCNFRVRLTSLQISCWSILPLSGSVLSPSHSLSQKQSLKPISSCTTCWETHWTAQEYGSGFRYFPLLFSKFWNIFHCLNMPLFFFKAFLKFSVLPACVSEASYTCMEAQQNEHGWFQTAACSIFAPGLFPSSGALYRQEHISVNGAKANFANPLELANWQQTLCSTQSEMSILYNALPSFQWQAAAGGNSALQLLLYPAVYRVLLLSNQFIVVWAF